MPGNPALLQLYSVSIVAVYQLMCDFSLKLLVLTLQDMQRIKMAEHSARTSQAQLATLSSSMAHLKQTHDQVSLLVCAVSMRVNHVHAFSHEGVQASTVTAKQLHSCDC